MANKIQLRRDTTANWNNVNPILADGEPGLDITTNQVKYGNGANAWVDLSYASGGGFTDVDGLVTFPGDLLIGTLWPEDPMPGGDKESVVWAKDDTEYLGLWWGGDQTYPDSGYGPVAGIMIGTGDEGGSMTDDFTNDPSPADTNITIAINDSTGNTLEWVFDRDGQTTFPSDLNILPNPIFGGTVIYQANAALQMSSVGIGGTTQIGWAANADTPGNVASVDFNVTSGNISLKTGNVLTPETWTFDAGGNLTLPEGGTLNSNPYVPAGAGFTMSAIELQTNTSSQAVVGIDNILTSGFEYTFFDNAEWYAQIVQAGEAVGPYRSVPVTWAAGSTRSSGFVLVQFTGGNSFGITPAAEGGGSADPGTWYFPATFGNPSSAVQGGILLTANSNVWKFGTDGNLTLPEGGTITSSGNLGNVVIQASSGTPRNFVFNTDGSITLPALYAQGNASIDSTNNQLSLTSSDTVDFANFSGMVLVNCYYSGRVTMFLCGSGSAAPIGNSAGTGTGIMSGHPPIGGYRFTATETGVHAFTSIKTRNGA